MLGASMTVFAPLVKRFLRPVGSACVRVRENSDSVGILKNFLLRRYAARSITVFLSRVKPPVVITK